MKLRRRTAWVPVERSQDDRFVLTGISTRCVKDAGTAVQFMNDEITDRFRVVTYNIKIFGQIKSSR